MSKTIFYAADLCDLKILSLDNIDTIEHSYAPGLGLSMVTVKLKQQVNNIDMIAFTTSQKVENPEEFIRMLVDMAKNAKCPEPCGERCQGE